MEKKKRIVIALGGNALGNTLPEQMAAVKITAKAIVDLIEEGCQVVISHGNGPQVGMINNAMAALSREDAKQPNTPLSVCVAMSQAYIGYDLQNALREELYNRNIYDIPVATMITQIRVDPEDPAFLNPSKPIGHFMTEEQARNAEKKYDYIMREDSGRGWRRVVASPKPAEIIEIGAIRSLVMDGIFGGVGSVLSFLPVILVLFFFLSILEDSGYMARIAFVMDTLLRKIGLSGRSFVPMLIGFGCSVPAVMASRTLYSERDRNMTIMLVPYISCSAKIPIYTVFTAAFFPDHGVLVMALLYFGGMAVGVIMALIFKKILFRGKPMPFVMELPNYRFPSLKSVLLLMWEKARDFIERAFTIIFVATIIIWFLQTFDAQLNVAVDSAQSLLAMIGQWLAPIFAPLGFSDWRISTALITGISAKEAVVSTLSVLLGTSSAGVSGAIGGLFTPLSAASFLTFTLLYTPCVAAIAAIRREMNSTVRTIGVVILQCTVAWLMAVLVYHVGGLLF